MNRTDRLLAILIELQRKQTVTAQSLAEKFETSIRTIYRDMDALSESGVPIFSMPGHGYSLMDGYFLPPIQLTPEEAVTLLLGGDYIEKTFTSSFSVHAQSAKEKLEVVLSTDQKKKVEELRGTFRFLLSYIFASATRARTTRKPTFLIARIYSKRTSYLFFLS